MTPPQQRVTRGFSMDENDGRNAKAPRRVRTRQQIMSGEGKRPPAAVELTLLASNPYNPREELTDIEETAKSLHTKGQIQPVTVARRAAFLQAHPGQEAVLGDVAEYVVIDGNRRLAAARLAGLSELRIDVNDDLASSASDMLETALIANIHRVDVPPLDQAKAIQDLVKVHGSQGQVAKRLGKTPAWVSQRLALLELTPDLQEKVETGELKVEPARRIGRLPKEQQEAEAEKAMNAVSTPRQRRALAESSSASAPNVNAVKTATEGPANTAYSAWVALPELSEEDKVRQLPYEDPTYVVMHLQHKMTSESFARGARVWLEVLRERQPEDFSALLLDMVAREQ
ncbi:ParB/RepB/Spo0J family partition protein [Streptomyces sp. 900105245]